MSEPAARTAAAALTRGSTEWLSLLCESPRVPIAVVATIATAPSREIITAKLAKSLLRTEPRIRAVAYPRIRQAMFEHRPGPG